MDSAVSGRIERADVAVVEERRKERRKARMVAERTTWMNTEDIFDRTAENAASACHVSNVRGGKEEDAENV